MSSWLDWIRPCPLPVRLVRTQLPDCGCGAVVEHQPLWRLGLSVHVPTRIGQGCTGRTPVWLTNVSLAALAHPSTTARHGVEGRALKVCEYIRRSCESGHTHKPPLRTAARPQSHQFHCSPAPWSPVSSFNRTSGQTTTGPRNSTTAVGGRIPLPMRS